MEAVDSVAECGMPPVEPVSAAAAVAEFAVAVATELVALVHRSPRTVDHRQSYLSMWCCWTAVRWWWMSWPLSVAAVVLVWISVVVGAVCCLSD